MVKASRKHPGHYDAWHPQPSSEPQDKATAEPPTELPTIPTPEITSGMQPQIDYEKIARRLALEAMLADMDTAARIMKSTSYTGRHSHEIKEKITTALDYLKPRRVMVFWNGKFESEWNIVETNGDGTYIIERIEPVFSEGTALYPKMTVTALELIFWDQKQIPARKVVNNTTKSDSGPATQ